MKILDGLTVCRITNCSLAENNIEESGVVGKQEKSPSVFTIT
jgi:hypothetical protein